MNETERPTERIEPMNAQPRVNRPQLTDSRGEEIERYTAELRKAVLADFLLLPKEERAKVLEEFLPPTEPGDGGDLPSRFDINRLSIEEVWALELRLLEHIPEEVARRRSWVLRERFREQVGDIIYAKYELSKPVDASDENWNASNLALLRADLVNLQRQLQRLSYFRISRNLMLGKAKLDAIVIMCVLLAGGAVVYWYLNQREDYGDTSVNLLLFVVYSGMMGSFMSLVQRFERVMSLPASFTTTVYDSPDISNSISRSYIATLILSGAIFAMLMYYFCISGVLQGLGNLLPVADLPTNQVVVERPTNNDANPESDRLACRRYGPSAVVTRLTCQDWTANKIAVILLLSFVSGFAERLIPGMLDSLVQKVNKQK